MEQESKGNRFLTFRLENEKYGIDILAVKEIIGYQKTIPIHQTPDYVKGVLNLRGQIIPVIDTAVKFGMDEKTPGVYTAIIIAMIHNISIGFIVDEVNEVITAAGSELSDPPEFGSTVHVDYLSKIVQVDSEVIMILNLDSIVDAREMQTIQASQRGEDSIPTQEVHT